jgi:dTDP-4-dehydrorhamnose reductase
MRILLLGKNGQLGWELRRSLATVGEVMALDTPEFDLAEESRVRQIVRQTQPQIIVNAAAYTAVDQAESEPGLAMRVNALAPGILAEEARALEAALVHYSSDYVFDGNKGSPYQESDPPNPLNLYGKSKLEGERAIQQVEGIYLILRTSWVYSLRRNSFVTKVLQWARQQSVLRVVEDQVGSPTWARMLAEATAQVLAMTALHGIHWLRERRGLYHLAGDGYASRLEWAKAILQYDPQRAEQRVQQIVAARSHEFPTPAQRPLYSALDCSRFYETFGLRLPPWEKALIMAMEERYG